ncbi:MAG TPA: 3'-5' exonuclease [Ottowia sp.]|uniref:3'-5' exonuclease n=1 Tax=Ottowia sp. TaxID=1898956 RepID=UPI002C4764EA|nr:3'-5' exonuclease [Ottowia sp.]HNI86365.1 3'-5' exonuclease [Ottowia sp.]HNJ46402.1 3'-5' exonuclease [Ottowia sp.]HNK53418.1 3'-5' exonuclease [Ottowia sp.]HNL42669.1 3'-5' exonuclease [Ottowia sp.]HNO42621.1 3'-5' exonuclease [Ottowia sp.]
MSGLLERLRRGWQRRQLTDPRWRFLLDEPPPHEWVALDCETTGLDTRTDEIVAIGAVRIVGQRILTSERLELLVRPEKGVSAESIRVHRLRQQDVQTGVPVAEAMQRLLHFIGARPLVGYYLEFDVAMINRALRATLGLTLPQEKIEVSRLYYDHKFRQLPPYRQHDQADIDLRFATIMRELGLPTRDAHDALNDAVMAALAFIKLRVLRGDAD